jgi:hypothetical protein
MDGFEDMIFDNTSLSVTDSCGLLSLPEDTALSLDRLKTDTGLTPGALTVNTV